MGIDFFSFTRNNAVLFYSGVEHSWDPQHPQFGLLREKFTEFLKVTKSSPLAVIEAQNWTVLSTEEETIQKGGEPSFIAFLCQQNNIPLVCFEPDRGEEMNSLLKEFSQEQIEYYYFARTIAQWYRLKEQPEINTYLNRFLDRDRRASGWQNFDFSIPHMAEIHKQFFGSAFDINDADFFRMIENPTREDNLLKEVVRASGSIRDDIVAQKIFKVWEQGRDLFVVYGRGHTKRHLDRLNLLEKEAEIKKTAQ